MEASTASVGGRGSLFRPVPLQKELSLWLGSWPHISSRVSALWQPDQVTDSVYSSLVLGTVPCWTIIFITYDPIRKDNWDNSIHFPGIWNEKLSHFLKKQGQDECTDILSGESAHKAGGTREAGWIPGLGRSPGGGNGKPLQYSCLKNPMDRGTWWAIAQRVTKSWTRLSYHAYKVVPRRDGRREHEGGGDAMALWPLWESGHCLHPWSFLLHSQFPGWPGCNEFSLLRPGTL